MFNGLTDSTKLLEWVNGCQSKFLEVLNFEGPEKSIKVGEWVPIKIP
jgi:hypothetical protein